MKTIIPEWHSGHFGDSFSAYDHLPAGADVLVLCVAGMCLEPISVLLPHQVYRQRLEELAKKHGAREFALLPYKSSEALLFKLPPSESAGGSNGP